MLWGLKVGEWQRPRVGAEKQAALGYEHRGQTSCGPWSVSSVPSSLPLTEPCPYLNT